MKCNKIIGIGWNYSKHILELNSTASPKPVEPIFFLKPSSSIIQAGELIEVPIGCIVHHEIELGVWIGKGGRDIKRKDAMDHVSGYCLGLTRS